MNQGLDASSSLMVCNNLGSNSIIQPSVLGGTSVQINKNGHELEEGEDDEEKVLPPISAYMFNKYCKLLDSEAESPPKKQEMPTSFIFKATFTNNEG
mgnify:CR=1 FL=1